MSEIPVLKSAIELEREDRLERLKNSPNGFCFEERDGKKMVLFLGTREEFGGKIDDHIVEFESAVQSEEEMINIIGDVTPSAMVRKIWTFIIDAYNQKEIPLVQSPPGTGKTHAFHRFAQLLHGEISDTNKEDLLCTPKTGELEILGKWVPNGDKLSPEKMREMLTASVEWKEFMGVFESELLSLLSSQDTLEEEVFAKKRYDLDEKYRKKQIDLLLSIFPMTEQSEWRFEEGALIRAYQHPDDPTDKGGFLLVDEIDNLSENYQNIFLQIAGEQGKLASKITVYSGAKKTVYKRGKDTFIGFAANYPELAMGKRSISAPLADRVTWLSITPEESQKDERRRIESFTFKSFSGSMTESMDSEVEQIRSLCSRTLAAFHIEWKKNFLTYNKIDKMGSGEMTREQVKEFSQRTTARVDRFVIDNLNNPEFANLKTGKVDMVKLLGYAIRTQYFKYLASEEAKRRAENEILLPLLYGGRKFLEKNGNDYVLKEEQALKEGPFTFVDVGGLVRPYNPEEDRGRKILAFDEAAEIVVTKAMRNKVEREKILEDKRRKISEFNLDTELPK